MSWWATAPMLLACVAMMVLPGAAMALCLGFRGISAVGLGPALTAGIAGVAAIVAPLAGLPWSIWTLGGFTVLVSGVALGLRKILLRGRADTIRRRPQDPWQVLLGAAAGVIIGGVIIARNTVGLIGNPQNIAQRYDNVFHLNAVRFIVETGNASTLNLGAFTGATGRGAAYPAVWHSFAALVADTTGADVIESVNLVNVVVAAVVWPVSTVFLARVVAGSKPIALLSTGILSAGFIAFPFLMMVWGPLFPYMLSVALLPAALGVAVLLVGMGRDADASRTVLSMALLVILAGIALCHMSSINILLVLTLPVLGWALARRIHSLVRSSAPPRAFLPIAMGAAAYIPLFLASWFFLRPGPYDGWQPHQTPGGAIGEAIANSPMDLQEVPVLVTVLGIAGLLTVARSKRDAWLGVVFVLLAFLYVVGAAFDPSPLRAALIGIWYGDTNRVAAFLPLVSALLGGLAVSSLWDTLVRRFADDPANAGSVRAPLIATPASRYLGLVGGVLVAFVLGTGVQSSALQTYLAESGEKYLRDWPESILSSDEYELLERLDEEVPPDAVIAVNPWNGGSLAYAFTGRPVTVYHLSGSRDPDVMTVSTALDRAPFSEVVCAAIEDTGVSFVLDFGDQYLAPMPEEVDYGGLEDLQYSGAVELIDEQGSAKLYRVTVCQ